MRYFTFLVALLPTLPARANAADQWQPAKAPLMTQWAADVSPDDVLPEYPRPQMVRDGWQNLNGLWEYAIVPRAAEQPVAWDGRILVPFAAESALSGVMKTVGGENRLWYRRTFTVSDAWRAGRVLLHFGGVDWESTVWVNGREVGLHRGGYDPFTFDVTGFLDEDAEQDLVVAVWDPTNEGTQPRGKQVKEPGGIFYTAVTGIWQTVWLEAVPSVSIEGLKITPDIDRSTITVEVAMRGDASGIALSAQVKADGKEATAASDIADRSLTLPLENPKLWSPDRPFLYDLHVQLNRGEQVIDEVQSYFGMRKIHVQRDEAGHLRLCLNNQPLFQLGPLDQGWWPDGLYTAPTDEALRYDIEVTKRLGFNMLRKHVKIEPARFYYHCDRLGMLVWQDMPNGHNPPSLRVRPEHPEDAERDPESARQFEAELKALIDHHVNHPSIVMWVPFNEGWGQYDTGRITDWIKQYDPTRLCNSTSGWTDRGVGDVYDAHVYPGPGMEDAGPDRASVLGEFGGLGLPIEGHLWRDNRNWGYRSHKTREDLQSDYESLIYHLRPMVGLGLAAAVYTQTTDVEGEVNGLMTYDREIVKFDADRLAALHAPFYHTSPEAWMLLEDSEHTPQTWRYRAEAPAESWQEADFDDTGWAQGEAPFAAGENFHFSRNTAWETPVLWLRREFTVDRLPDGLALKVYNDVERAVVYLNGRQVAELTGPCNRHYLHLNISQHAGKLRQGRNVLAIEATQPKDRRGIDVGVYGVGDYAAGQLKALILDGQNNHKWVETTPVIKAILEEQGLFSVDVATAPPKGSNMESYQPSFADYDVVVSNYNGDMWPEDARTRFVEYVRNGGGFVVIHAANNAFPDWPQYNQIIGLGGWGGRDETDGPYVFYRNGKLERDYRPGSGGTHGPQRPYPVDVRVKDHPITQGLPDSWMHARDEMYALLRGPAENLTVLATALSNPKHYEPEHEPMLFTVEFGEGRMFQTALGHDAHAMRCVGFAVTLHRGAEWAATGRVTHAGIPDFFPGEDATSLRDAPEK
jgi:type 1 glutamine amidotransferase